MDAQSPPKRMTRARAAAKTSEPAAKPTRVVTAAAKAKTARSTTSTTTTRTAVKRKSPSDDEEDNHEMQPAKKMTTVASKTTRSRGRPKKVAVEEPASEPAAPEPAPATAVRTRGRPKKTVDPVAVEPVKPARTTRTTKKTVTEDAAAPAPVKKTTRGRPALASSIAATTSRPLAKPAVKKTVKFEEPEKENVEPITKPTRKTLTKASAPAPAPTTGLRGKPIRRAASAATTRAARGTRAATVAADPSEKVEKPMPLSPKKVNQLTLNRVESDDELGMDEKLPVRRFKKLPVKPKSSSTVKTAVPVVENDENTITTNRAENEFNLMLATPAKRMPASPWKGSIRSPAKRVEGLIVAAVTQIDGQTSQAPSRMGLLQSPAKRQPLSLNPLGADITNGPSISPVKLSFLSSPAKRPPISPIKALPRAIEEEEPMNRTPAPKPTLLASPLPRKGSPTLEEELAAAEEEDSDDGGIPDSPTRLSFPGRLSAVLPRHADPALTPPSLAVSEGSPQLEIAENTVEEAARDEDESEGHGEPMMVDDQTDEPPATDSVSTTPPSSPLKTANPMFGLRDKDLYDQAADSDSDNESPVKQGRFTSAFSTLPATPCPVPARTSKIMQSAGRSTTRELRSDDKLGFTPLADQLSEWTAGPSPQKTRMQFASPTTTTTTVFAVATLQNASTPAMSAQNTFFEDEMHVRPGAMDAKEVEEVEEDAATEVEDNDDRVMEDASFTEEDMELAKEANGMSLVEKEQVDSTGQDHDDAISEASQDYGDENAFPIDPSLTGGNRLHASTVPPVTPQRVLQREFHTVAKVPLKPADDSTPRPKLENRSYSVSRLPVPRPTERLTRSSTVISYSPTKGGDDDEFEDQPEERAESVPPVTPQKSDIWSTIGTPARTPRRDLNPALLRGAVVFVDVHTSDGADARGIFVELLTQMGARCVKTWAWNPNSSSESGADSRVGITHVVYKDGGKRTLEKVRESGGVVQCVGVSWVLDCERENEWLDEAPYQIDTSLVPRGGARRRKSMEPRAIANLNGMLVPSPVNNSRGSNTAPNTPANNRRASALWIRSPEKSLDDEADHEGSDNSDADGEDEETEWGSLTPVPKTPAPETIARFAANISPGSTSPSSDSSDESEDSLSRDDDADSRRQEMLLRTCPPKRTTFVELGNGILRKEKDEGVLMRLMAARRKSLQFAPKVGSPLAKAWKAWN